LDLSDYRCSTLDAAWPPGWIGCNLRTPESILKRLRSDPLECDRLIETIDIKVLSYFRDPLARNQQSGLVRELPLGLKEWLGNDHPVKGPTTSPSIQKLW